MKPHWMFFPLSLVYGVAVWLRNLFFDIGLFSSAGVGVPVISVGNLTAGGTGKTPLVVLIVQILKECGKHPAVVSRGYGRSSDGTIVVSDGRAIIATSVHGGDEPVQIARMTNAAVVIADENRVRGARKAVKEFGADVIVLDDGFQHRQCWRGTDIVLVDAQHPPYETFLLPAGYRRELMSGLNRASAVMVTKAKNSAAAQIVLNDARLGFKGPAFSSSYRPKGIRHVFGGVMQSLEILKGHSAVALCGIAVPESFRAQLESIGVSVKAFFPFPDHHRFSESEVAQVVSAFRSSGADYILTTEKDTVRLNGFDLQLATLPVSALVMEVDIHQNEEWKNFILSRLHT